MAAQLNKGALNDLQKKKNLTKMQNHNTLHQLTMKNEEILSLYVNLAMFSPR